MTKKSANLGKAVAPGAGGQSGVDAALALTLAYYNGRPQQKGQIAGLSPNMAMERAILHAPPAVLLREKDFDLVFGADVERTVRQGAIQHEKRQFYADELLPLSGEKVWVRVGILGAGDTMMVMDKPGGVPQFAVHAHEARSYFHDDGGAEAARLKKAASAGMRATANGAAAIDPRVRMAQYATLFAPAPRDTASAATIAVAGNVTKAANRQAAKQARKDKMLRRLEMMKQLNAA
jgi:hypothetical protein